MTKNNENIALSFKSKHGECANKSEEYIESFLFLQ